MSIRSNDSTIKTLTISWALLLILTLTAIILSQLNIEPSLLVTLVLAVTVFKSQIVIDIFMGLKEVDYRWRRLMLSYIIFVPLILGCIYLTA